MSDARTTAGDAAGDAGGAAVVAALREALGPDRVLDHPVARRTYAYDATALKHLPRAVVLPRTTAEVAATLAAAAAHGMPVIGRGAGTNASGGTLPTAGGIVVSLARMNRILQIDTSNRWAVVEPGVTSLGLQEALRPLGYTYAPDPSSGKVSTIGGNIAENAGGPHCLKYGVTANHLLSVELVRYGGEVLTLGSPLAEDPGYDLAGLVCASEGTLGVITRATVRIVPLPRAQRILLAVFDSPEACGEAVSAIIAAQIIPAALEFMNRGSVEAVHDSGFTVYPRDAEAVLVIELDGDAASVADEAGACAGICREHGATVRAAADEAEQRAIWQGRKSVAGAMARRYVYRRTEDVTVPRPRLPEIIRRIGAVSARYGVVITISAHAGDGNLHPSIPYDLKQPETLAQALAAEREIIAACVELGGTISGEHGIGWQKLEGMSIMYSDYQLAYMHRIRRAFDPAGGMNPGKKIPAPRRGY